MIWAWGPHRVPPRPSIDRGLDHALLAREARRQSSELEAVDRAAVGLGEGKVAGQRPQAWPDGRGGRAPSRGRRGGRGRFETLRGEMAPRTSLGNILVHRVAMLSVRLDRSTRQESAALSTRVERAGVDFDEARMVEVSRLIDLLVDDPATAVRMLRRMPEGVDRMVAAWVSLRALLEGDTPDTWRSETCALAEALTGRPVQAPGTSRIEALWRATGLDFSHLKPGETEGLDSIPSRDWATARLIEIVEAQLAELRAHRETLDLGAIARERSRAADVALLDTTKEGILARKYEAAAERALHRAPEQLREVESEVSDEEEVAEENGAVGSFSPGGEKGTSRRLGRRPDAARTSPEGRPGRPIGGDGASAGAPKRLE